MAKNKRQSYKKQKSAKKRKKPQRTQKQQRPSFAKQDLANSSKEIIDWLTKHWHKQYITAFRSYVLTFASLPSTYDVINQMVYHGLFGNDEQMTKIDEVNRRRKIIYDNITKPFHDNLESTQEGAKQIVEAHRAAIQDAIRHSLKLRNQTDTGYCHLLDFEQTGQFNTQQEYAYFNTWFSVPGISIWSDDPSERIRIAEELKQIFRQDTIQPYAVDGFLATCEDIHNYKAGELNHMLDWYLLHLDIVSCPNSVAQILKGMQEKCMARGKQCELLLQYYEDRKAIFNLLFEQFPEYNFIEQGKFERYELLGDFARKLGITMGGEAYTLPLFPPQKTEQKQGEGTPETATTPPISDKEYRTIIMESLDKLHRQIIHHSTDVYWINIWPNRIKTRRTAKIVGKYIAIVYEYQNETWILVESIEHGNAVYLWHGANADEGLNLFIQHKTYVKTQPNVYRRNHGIRRNKATYDIYLDLLKEANGLGVLG